MNMLTVKLRNSLLKRGIAETAKRALLNILDIIRWHLDASFDRRYNVDTSGKISLGVLKIGSPNIENATWYEPVSTSCFKQLLRELRINYEDYIFIDYGSGKGRALFLAAEYPFAKILGIEFSPELNEVAIQNIAKYTNPNQHCVNIEVLCMDAVDFELPTHQCVLFFYSPFKAPIFLKVLEKIKKSLAMSPRSLYILFIGLIPESVEALKSSGFKCREVALKFDYLRWEEKKALILHSGISEGQAKK
jgi:SAM-dependent methyltransferase